MVRMQKTSLDAYDAVRPTIASVRNQIIAALLFESLTCEELENRLARPHQSISARLSELRRDGIIRDSGERRRSRSGNKAIVWSLSVSPADSDVLGKRRCRHCGRYIAADKNICNMGHAVGDPLGTYGWVSVNQEHPPYGVPCLIQADTKRTVAYTACYHDGAWFRVRSGIRSGDVSDGWSVSCKSDPIPWSVTRWRLLPE